MPPATPFAPAATTPDPTTATPVAPSAAAAGRQSAGVSLFWRTFMLLGTLLLVSNLAWLQMLRTVEQEPRAIQTAQQIASLVNLSRAALVHADAIARIPLIKTMSAQEAVRILPREPDDRFEAFDDDALSRRITQELQARLGPGTVVANSVNKEGGLWVSFTIDEDSYWMLTDRSRLNPPVGQTWIVWLAIAAALSLAGAAFIAGLINRPLKALARAARRVREGNYDAPALKESATTVEIEAVNREFNRMSRQLAQVEQDRAIMLAGISHDLRTPLSRLRLETELSVQDAQAQQHMVADIEQLDAIIHKFMDYARPDQVVLAPVNLSDLVERSVHALADRSGLRFTLHMNAELRVMGDEVELTRVAANLFENARRYGRTADGETADVDVLLRPEAGDWVLLQVRDHGKGVPEDTLPQLTKAFFRGDSARTSANGAGLGLAIVDKNVQRMGGRFTLSNHPEGGLVARVLLRRAPA